LKSYVYSTLILLLFVQNQNASLTMKHISNIKGVPIVSVLGIISSVFMLSYIATDIIIAGIILVVVGIVFTLTLDKLSEHVYLEED